MSVIFKFLLLFILEFTPTHLLIDNHRIRGIAASIEEEPDSVATELQFPYQVSLEQQNNNEWNHACSGSILAKSKVLTSAHCVTQENGTALPTHLVRVMSGAFYVDKSWDQSYHEVSQFIVHPLFKRGNASYDYTIIVIKSKFNFYLPTHAPIKMAPETATLHEGTICTVSRWGASVPKTLEYSNVTIGDSEYCADIFKHLNLTTPMICAEANVPKNAVRFDAGSPLVCNDELVGIVAYPMSTGMKGIKKEASVYANDVHGATLLIDGLSSNSNSVHCNCFYILFIIFISLLIPYKFN